MDLQKKLEILSGAAKYDASCSSSGSSRKNVNGGLGNNQSSGICHSWSDDGRCISLLKILLTNICTYNCVYCVNRATNDIPRASFTPEEIVDLTINFYRRNYIEGLFLSSAIIRNPDYTMELMLKTVRKLRIEHKFNGYIHLKAIPGTDSALIAEAGQYVDRMSVNIELPSNDSLKLLAPQKKKESIIKPMGFINSKILESNEVGRFYKKPKKLFVPGGQSTQLIVGATPDHDFNILKLTQGLYRRFQLKRVYYSAYVPVLSHPNLPAVARPPLQREHRLYQADWLLRFYGFKAEELLDDNHVNFSSDIDPKSDWAIRNIHLFPIEINTADYELLIRVPGIGVLSARRIINARKMCSLGYEHLKKIGVVLKRARHFITCRGKYYGEIGMNELLIRNFLTDKPVNLQEQNSDWQQLSIFSHIADSNILENNSLLLS